MATKIKYGIHRNPLPNEQGDYTYQVRLEPSGTFKLEDFFNKLQTTDKLLSRQAEHVIRQLKQDMTVESVMEAGVVGHSANHSEQEIQDFLYNYIRTHGSFTRLAFTTEMGLTKYMGQKWLDDLADDPQSPIYKKKVGRIFLYKLKD